MIQWKFEGRYAAGELRQPEFFISFCLHNHRRRFAAGNKLLIRRGLRQVRCEAKAVGGVSGAPDR